MTKNHNRRVVITGIGIVSCIGNNTTEVTHSLKNGLGGITSCEAQKQFGLKSQVSGRTSIDTKSKIEKKIRRFMSPSSCYAFIATEEALKTANLNKEDIAQSPKIGLIVSTGGSSVDTEIHAVNIGKTKGVKFVSPFTVPKCMSSTASANLATAFQITGISYSITAACSTSAHCIGHSADLIISGKQDLVIAGGAEEHSVFSSMMFDAMGALTSQYNHTPNTASRTYDKDRDGFAIAEGAGILILEERERALHRNAPLYAELIGYGANSDGDSMVRPSGNGAALCMKASLQQITENDISYINTHGTSTPAGDIIELMAIKNVFNHHIPPISSTKSLTGHSLGAAGAHEAIYSILMLHHSFIAPSINIQNMDENAKNFPIITQPTNQPLNAVLTNSFGFGGTNACLVFKKP